ncbi:hypothetical protein ABW19_dt0203673 [Dactylella cylindrospora]|nr:hypothetical protein ABW19_dt0203673 [Dactylella cylindrospora]
MATILLLIFLSAVCWHATGILITLSPVFWTLYVKLIPSRASFDVTNLRKQQVEVLRIRKEITGTSSQDEFAKWAKLRREHDKKVADMEKLSQTISSHRSNFNRIISSIRWLVFSATGLFLQFWYRKEPVFWLPNGWLPDYLEWVLSFPQAPSGSVSVNVWSACAAIATKLVAQSIESAYHRPQPGPEAKEDNKPRNSRADNR